MAISIETRIGILPKTLQEYHFSNIKGLGFKPLKTIGPYDRGQVYSLLLFLSLTDFHVYV